MTEKPEDRSRVMRAVKGWDTGLEMIVRRLTHAMGYRYRLHRKDLPGKPDMVFPARRKVVFVNGCFWHQHNCPRGARSPKSHRDYWIPKLERNRQRDAEHQDRLAELGWNVLVIWECETKDRNALCARIRKFLEG
ncbi:MAG: DNA mismatch endonuclease Vsr [Candidatus Glassbacteria bacterium]|nr:DNA mismatch endonuclease Vsr [Candidatus Glassbacteria bacterium]